MIVAMIAGSLFAYALARRPALPTVPTIGTLPSGIPTVVVALVRPGEMARDLAGRARADGAGLTEAVSIARAVAVKSGQRIDGNQEFIGQGLSNIVGAFSVGVPVVGLVQPQRHQLRSRSAHAAFRRVSAAVLLVVVLLAVAPLAAYLPLAVMAGLLFVVAWGLIDVAADAPDRSR